MYAQTNAGLRPMLPSFYSCQGFTFGTSGGQVDGPKSEDGGEFVDLSRGVVTLVVPRRRPPGAAGGDVLEVVLVPLAVPA